MNLVKLKQKKQSLLQLITIIKAMQMVGRVNFQKASLKLKLLNFKILDLFKIEEYDQEINILFSCDQGFNGNFINIINKYIEIKKINFKIIGKKHSSFALFKKEQDVLNFSNHLLTSLNNKVKFIVHYLNSNEQILNQFLIIDCANKNLAILILSKFLYNFFLISLLEENKLRLITTEKAKTNAEKYLKKTQSEINKTRQNKITNELNELLSSII